MTLQTDFDHMLCQIFVFSHMIIKAHKRESLLAIRCWAQTTSALLESGKCLYTKSSMFTRHKRSLFFLPRWQLPLQLAASDRCAPVNRKSFQEHTSWATEQFALKTTLSFNHIYLFLLKSTWLGCFARSFELFISQFFMSFVKKKEGRHGLEHNSLSSPIHFLIDQIHCIDFLSLRCYMAVKDTLARRCPSAILPWKRKL